MKMIKLTNFDDAFKVDINIIDDYFELVYHAITDLTKNYSADFHIQINQILSFQINQLLKSQSTNQLQKTIFLFLNAITVTPQKCQDLAKVRQQMSQPQILMYKKSLKLVHFILQSQTLPREASRYIFDFIQLFLDLKDSECRELLVKILTEAVLAWKDNLQYLKTKITNLIYESDTVIVPLSNFFQEVYQKHDSFVLETLILLMNYVNEQQSESIAVKNLKELLSLTAKRNPHMFYLNLPTFLHLYDCENYHLRNGLTEILGNVIEHLVKQRDDNENYDKARDRLIDTLIVRQHDKVAFARSQILQCFNTLLSKNCISDLKPILQMAVERIRDISGWVRKGAVQLLKQICKYYHYIYVESQGRNKFYRNEEVEQIMERNKEEIEEMKKVFEEGQTSDIEELRANAERVTKQQAQMEEYQHFMKMIKKASHLITQLLGSKNQTDVIAAIKYFSYLKKHELDGYQNGLKKMMILIWGHDKQIIQEIIKKFWKLFMKTREIQPLIQLMENSSIKEIVCIEKFIQYYLTKSEEYKIKSSMIEQLWQDLDSTRITLLRIIYTSQPTLLTEERQKQLLQILEDYKRETINFHFVKEICTIIEKVNPEKLQKFVSTGTFLLYKYFGVDKSWYKGCEAVISLISITSCPEVYYEFILKKLTLKTNGKVDQIELEQMDEKKLCQLIFCLGHISLKMLVHIDNLHTQVRNERLRFEKELDKDSQELDKIAGGLEAEQERIHELINKITEEQILQNNLISKYMPIIMFVIKNLNEIFIEQEDDYKNTELEQICVLTLCKFMCVSEQFCRDNLKLLFVIMKSKNSDQIIKNNIIISIGDLLHRFPNTVELFHKEIFSNLYDSSFAVRKITLLVLTHLVLNDMIKSKSSLAHIPNLLVDEDPQIPPMVRYFLQELQKKDPRSISNMLPDIIQNAGVQGEQILPQILSAIDKSQVDGLVQKLITILEKCQDQDECRNIALVFNLLPIQLSSLKLLLDGWEVYRSKCEDSYIQEQLKNLLKKIRNPSQEMKQLMEEYEVKLDNYQQETFDARRKQQKKTKAAKKVEKNEKNVMEIEETKEQGVRPQRKKKKAVIQSEDEWEQ